jgi:hypothetical protein
MADHPQNQILNIAGHLNVDPREVEAAVSLMRAGRSDLIAAVTTKRLTIKAALQAARSNPNLSTPNLKVRF